MYAGESSRRRHIISIGVKSTHVEEEKNHIEEYHMPGSWMGHRWKCSKKNWSGQSLIRFHGIISRREDRRNTHDSRKRKSYKSCHLIVRSSREDLDHAISATAEDPASVTAPDNGADALAAHQSVTGQFLSAATLLKVPEAQAGIMPSRDKLTSIRRQ